MNAQEAQQQQALIAEIRRDESPQPRLDGIYKAELAKDADPLTRYCPPPFRTGRRS